MYPYNIEIETPDVQDVTCETQSAYTQPHDEAYDFKVMEMILYSHKHEEANINYYNDLGSLANNHHAKRIINDIGLDCARHCHMLADVCDRLPKDLCREPLEYRTITEDYKNEIESCIFMLMDDVEFYRHLMFSEPRIKDKMHEIIIDKQNHIMKLMFLGTL